MRVLRPDILVSLGREEVAGTIHRQVPLHNPLADKTRSDLHKGCMTPLEWVSHPDTNRHWDKTIDQYIPLPNYIPAWVHRDLIHYLHCLP